MPEFVVCLVGFTVSTLYFETKSIKKNYESLSKSTLSVLLLFLAIYLFGSIWALRRTDYPGQSYWGFKELASRTRIKTAEFVWMWSVSVWCWIKFQIAFLINGNSFAGNISHFAIKKYLDPCQKSNYCWFEGSNHIRMFPIENYISQMNSRFSYSKAFNCKVNLTLIRKTNQFGQLHFTSMR